MYVQDRTTRNPKKADPKPYKNRKPFRKKTFHCEAQNNESCSDRCNILKYMRANKGKSRQTYAWHCDGSIFFFLGKAGGGRKQPSAKLNPKPSFPFWGT